MTNTRPQPGDRIMIFKEKWLKLILKREKTMEIRSRALKGGKYWLGYKGLIRGMAVFGDAVPVQDDETWASYRDRHRVETELPYKKTWGLPILRARSIAPVKYEHPRGSEGIVRYRVIL